MKMSKPQLDFTYSSDLEFYNELNESFNSVV